MARRSFKKEEALLGIARTILTAVLGKSELSELNCRPE